MAQSPQEMDLLWKVILFAYTAIQTNQQIPLLQKTPFNAALLSRSPILMLHPQYQTAVEFCHSNHPQESVQM
jgi:hypothetical protein